MHKIFVNLKRFEVPRKAGGLSPADNPVKWIEAVIDQTVAFGLGSLDKAQLTYMRPEGLVAAGAKKASRFDKSKTKHLAIGCQGVHWEDIRPGKNFGAFTASLPAAPPKTLERRGRSSGIPRSGRPSSRSCRPSTRPSGPTAHCRQRRMAR